MKYILCAFFCVYTYNTFSQGFDKDWGNCIIELDKELPNGNLELHGTGFALYNYEVQRPSKIVTCAHLLRNSSIYIRIPATDSAIKFLDKYNYKKIISENTTWLFDGYSFRCKLELIKNVTFITNDSLDIGILSANLNLGIIATPHDTIYKLTKLSTISKSLIREKNQVDIGTNIYFLGFPFSIGSNSGYYGTSIFSDKKINPLIRGGLVAWKSDETEEFLVDGYSFGGNSGSPVFTQSNSLYGIQPALIGMVIGHLNDPLDSMEVNQGLARCIWIDEILKLSNQIK